MNGFIELTEEKGYPVLLRIKGIDAIVAGEEKRRKFVAIYMRNGYKVIVRECIDEIDALIARSVQA